MEGKIPFCRNRKDFIRNITQIDGQQLLLQLSAEIPQIVKQRLLIVDSDSSAANPALAFATAYTKINTL